MWYETRDAVIQNLRDAGCDESQISRFMEHYDGGDCRGECKTLAEHRKCLLDTIHLTQRQIDCLDYLAYQIKKENKS